MSSSATDAVATATAAPRPYTSAEESRAAHAQLVQTFASGRTKSLRWRKWQLKQFWWMLEDNEAAIVQALAADLRRHHFETLGSDLMALKNDVLDHLRHLEAWAADAPVAGAGFLFGTLGRARVRCEPRGVALVIGAWNYPFLLTLQPVIAAIAAGCCVLVKPSELTVASQNLLADLVARYLDPAAVRLVTGGPAETTALLALPFDHIFFTGSTAVAKIVAAAAAPHLTPTLFELGGQGPAVVTATADVDLAAKRVAYAKVLNAGQICLSVNHVFVDPAVHDAFVARLVHWAAVLSGGGAAGDMCKIVNARHFQRLAGLLADTGGTVHRVWPASEEDAARHLLGPAVVTDVTAQDVLLRQELFGPICPVIKATYAEAVDDINARPHPLAIYIFSKDKSEIDHVIQNTTSGGVTINDVMMHFAVPGAPFGGVGDSGMGCYHGKYGFLAFSHQRTILELPTWLEGVLAFRYPPFDMRKKGHVVPKNNLGFRRGETMEDQTIGSGSGRLWVALGAAAAVVVGGLLAKKGALKLPVG